MIIGILKETINDNRVAMLPESVADLIKLKAEVYVEKGAGENAFVSDEEYKTVGASVVSKKEVLEKSKLIIKINPAEDDELKAISKYQVFTSTFGALSNKELVKKLQELKLTTFSLELVPRTTRAQAMDILSSMATVSGYKAVLDAAMNLPHFFPMFMSAAGTIKPSKVLILGAGVAGLQAIATARKLGAVVHVFDVRSAVKEEVMSLGGKFIEVEGAKEDAAAGGYAVEQTEEFKMKQKELIHDVASKSNVVICTAQIPGRKAPVLIEERTVKAMAAGSVVIDLAASTGGNCEVTKNGEAIFYEGVKVIGKSDYPSDMPHDASKMFGKNLVNLLKLMIDEEGNFNLNFEDDIVKGTCLTHDGEVINERVKQNM